jgi:hypothetical protein
MGGIALGNGWHASQWVVLIENHPLLSKDHGDDALVHMADL